MLSDMSHTMLGDKKSWESVSLAILVPTKVMPVCQAMFRPYKVMLHWMFSVLVICICSGICKVIRIRIWGLMMLWYYTNCYRNLSVPWLTKLEDSICHSHSLLKTTLWNESQFSVPQIEYPLGVISKKR